MGGGQGGQELSRVGVAVESSASALEACRDAIAIVVATEWPEYGNLDWRAVADAAKGRVIVDARQIVDVAAAQTAGFVVIVNGRRAPSNAT